MDHFINRKSQYSNRKRLEIKNLTRNSNGELSELIVDVFRNDGAVYESGTALTAEGLNKAFTSVDAMSSLMFKYYLATIQDNLTVSWYQVPGNKKSTTFRIGFTKQKFYLKLKILTIYLSGRVIQSESYADVIIDELDNLNSNNANYTMDLNFYVEVYMDAAREVKLTELEGTVHYTATSTDPVD